MSSVEPLATSAISASDPIDVDESSPLLLRDALSKGSIPHASEETTDRNWYPEKYKTAIVITLCTICIFIIDFGLLLQLAPLTRILESIICNSYYAKHTEFGLSGSVPEAQCKIAPIQSELAMLKGWSALFDNIPSVLLTVPYGFVADKWGRKPVLLLSLAGCIMGNIWTLILVWTAPILTVIGGGEGVAQATLTTFIADVVSETQRSTVFFGITATALATQLVAVPLSSVLMERNPWSPMFLGCGAFISGYIVIAFFPETLPAERKDSGAPTTESPSDDEDTSTQLHLFQRLIQGGKLAVKESKALFVSPIVTALVFTFFVNSLGRSSGDLVLQYASRRYHWTIAQASVLLPLRAGVQLGLLLVVLPYLSYVLIKYASSSADTKDLYISRGSVVLLLIGSVGIGLSPTPIPMAFFLVLNSLGYGFPVTVRSLATSLVEPHHIARLYAAIATMDKIGGMVTGPLISSLYSAGLILDGGWVGLPFFATGVLFFIVALPLFLSNLKPKVAV